MSRRVILIRHGRSEWNVAGRFQGQLESDLDDVGRSQALDAAEALARRHPAAVISSDSRRCADTAAEIAREAGLPLALDPRLREIDLGAWSGLTRAEVQERFPDEWAAWIAGHDVARGGGEGSEDVAARARACVEEHLARLGDGDAPLVVVTHGFTARACLHALLGIDQGWRRRLGVLGNCRWITLERADDDGWRLLEYGAGVGDPYAAMDVDGDPVAARRVV